MQQLCLQVGYGQVGKTNNLYLLMMILVLNYNKFNQAARIVSPKIFVSPGCAKMKNGCDLVIDKK